MSGRRLRLTTSRPAGYRRGGQVIGNAGAPTLVERGDMTVEQVLAVLRDPNVAMAVETEDGVFMTMTADERAAIAYGIELDLAEREPNTVEPQVGGSDPDDQASEAGGPEATAADSAASAGGAVTSEPTVQPIPTAPEPAAKPTPTPRARGKAKGSPA